MMREKLEERRENSAMNETRRDETRRRAAVASSVAAVTPRHPDAEMRTTAGPVPHSRSDRQRDHYLDQDSDLGLVLDRTSAALSATRPRAAGLRSWRG